MCKILLKIVLVLVFFLKFGFLSAQSVKAEALHIFKIFQNSKAIMMEGFLQQNNNNLDFEKKYLAVIDREICLLSEIIEGFNNGLLVLLEYKFWGICNFFKDLELIEPRNIRAFKRKIIKFDEFIYKKLKTQKLLNEVEIGMCNKIIEFDSILLKYFLRHDFYSIDTFDEVKDMCFYRPVEWIENHPMFSVSVFLIISGFLFYYYVWPYVDFFDEDAKDGYVLIKNHNQKVNAIQFKQQRTQWGLTCGAHAIFNFLALRKGNGDSKVTFDLINDETSRQMCFDRWQKIVPDRKGLNSLDGDDIWAILRSEGIPDNDVIRIENVNMLEASHFDELNNMYHIVDGKFRNVADSIQEGELQENEFIDTDGVRKIIVEEAIHGERLANFRSGNPQFFIVNTAKRTDLKKENSYGHWLPFMVMPGGQGKTDATILTVDSSGNSNRTNSWILNRLHQIFTQD